jgi:hypothetical protein
MQLRSRQIDHRTTVYKVGDLEVFPKTSGVSTIPVPAFLWSRHSPGVSIFLVPALFRERRDPLAVMLTREAELGEFLHLDFAVLLRMTSSINALLGTLKVVTR